MKTKETLEVIGVLEEHGELELVAAIRGAAERGTRSHEFVFRSEGDVLAVGGAVEIMKGVAEVWMKILNYDEVSRLKKSFLVTCIKALDLYAEEAKARRLQCTAEAGDPKSNTFLIALGFLPEGFMLRYGKGGTDHIRYARIYG